MTTPAANVFPYSPAGLTGAPFFTALELADRLQIDESSINIGAANLLAQLASDAVREDVLLQVDYVADDQITLWGNNSDVLILPQRPVTAVSSVTLAGQALALVSAGSSTDVPMYDWRPAGALRLITYGASLYAGQSTSNWPLGAVVQVTYSHGYATVPSAMKHVALELAAGVYSNIDLQDTGRTGWVEWKSEHITLDLTPDQRKSLDLYRNVSLTV